MTACGFTFIMAAITSVVHFLIITLSHEPAMQDHHLFFTFQWPSVAYALDIFAWDWFYALAMFFAAPVFNNKGLERTVKFMMLISGLLSLTGLIGIPLGNMQFRNIGIIGYGVLGPVIFLLIGILMQRKACI